MCQARAPAGTEKDARLQACGERRPRHCEVARRRHDGVAPQLFEISAVPTGQRRRSHFDEDVLLPRPGVVGPVGRTGQDRRVSRTGIPDHVLVVHEVGHPVDRPEGDVEAVQQVPVDGGRSRVGFPARVILVEEDADAGALRS